MFSGIVSEIGTVLDIRAGAIHVRAAAALARTRVGSSISVNGVCLTAARRDEESFTADVMPETLHRTALGLLVPGSAVNLEPALAVGDEIGGHFVQGHVDGIGTVAAIRDDGNARWLEIDVPDKVRPYCVYKGSIAVDGTSLTIARVDGSRVAISLIPHTLASTIAGDYKAGTLVNLEADVLAKYVARYVAEHHSQEEG